MKRNKLNIWLMSAIVCGISLSFASCEDKDDLSIEEQQQQEESARIDKASRYWDVVGHLVSMENYTEEWEGKTFEPTIGSQDESDPQTRIVATNTASYAAERYSTLVGATGITESTVSHEWSDPEVGTLTYRKVTDGTAWAEVTVDIPTVPHLSKIIYRSPEQGNTNGGVVGGGCAYYRFGDVIGVTNADGKNEYWVCVRPAFDPEGKGDSHWMTVSPLPSKNIWTYDKASNKKIYTMPTALGTDEDHMKNFAEMLFAICYPSEWHANATGTHHPDIFGDFEVENIGYHNMYFWENVQDAWKELNVFETLFGSGKDLKWFTDNIKSKGLYFLYKGYKWKTKLFNGPTLFQAHYVYEKDSEYTNMRTPNSKALTEVEKDVIYKKDPSKDIEFSVKTECTDVKPYIVKPAYFGDDNPRWIVRYATGKQLSNTGKYPNNQAMIPGSETVYRYYRDVDKREDLSAKPQEEKRIKKATNYGFFRPGVIIRDENGTDWMCLIGWSDIDGVVKTTDRKVRFISLNGITSVTEIIGGRTGQFIGNTDLLPESQAPLVSALLTDMMADESGSDWGSNREPNQSIKKKFKEYFGLELTGACVTRDTLLTYDGKSAEGFTRAVSVFYKPDGGRTTGTQPYLRFVLDGSHVGSSRNIVPTYMRYWYGQFYKKYNDGSGQRLDATHLFTCSDYITATKPVKADKWSICRLSGTQTREGDVKPSDLHTENFDWKLFQDGSYKSAYHEPIVAVRYMEITDDDLLVFKGEYNGKKYSLVWEPGSQYEETVRLSLFIPHLGNLHNYRFAEYNYEHNGCNIDGQKFELNFFSFLNTWE